MSFAVKVYSFLLFLSSTRRLTYFYQQRWQFLTQRPPSHGIILLSGNATIQSRTASRASNSNAPNAYPSIVALLL